MTSSTTTRTATPALSPIRAFYADLEAQVRRDAQAARLRALAVDAGLVPEGGASSESLAIVRDMAVERSIADICALLAEGAAIQGRIAALSASLRA